MMEALRDWHRHYVSNVWQPADRWETVTPEGVQLTLIDVPGGRCPRSLLALRQRGERLHRELVDVVEAELDLGYTMQSYYSWIEDLYSDVLLEEPLWYRYDSAAGRLATEMRRHRYDGYEHEYKICSLIKRMLRDCARAWRAVALMEHQTFVWYREAARGDARPTTHATDINERMLCNS